MAEEVRICNPFEVEYFIEYRKSGFVGFTSDGANELIHDLSKGRNLTVTIRSAHDGVGEPLDDTNGLFSGCIGLVQKNLSDMLLDEVTYPSLATNIQQGHLSTDIFTRFFSFYFPRGKEESQAVQLESCFFSLSLQVWILCFITFITTLVILVTHIILRRPLFTKKRLHPTSRYILYQVLTHMTKCGQLWSYSGALKKISFICLSIFSFVVLFYFAAMMSTEQVVIKSPDTFRSYQDLLDRQVGLSFLLFSDIYVKFKFAKPDTVESRLWQITSSKYVENDILYETHPGPVGKALAKTLRRETVGVTDTSWAPFMLHHMCLIVVDQSIIDALSRELQFARFKAKSIYPYVGHDDNAASTMRGFILSQTPTASVIYIKSFLRRLLETGYLMKKTSRIGDIDVMATIYKDRVKKSKVDRDFQQCDSNQIITPEGHLESTGLQNVKNFFFIILFIYAVLGLLLLIELMIDRISRKARENVTRRVTFQTSGRI